jgi:hypothetical protein
MSERVQVICNDTGESHYVRPNYKPDADELRAPCPCGRCAAAEYREPEGIEA